MVFPQARVSRPAAGSGGVQGTRSARYLAEGCAARRPALQARHHRHVRTGAVPRLLLASPLVAALAVGGGCSGGDGAAGPELWEPLGPEVAFVAGAERQLSAAIDEPPHKRFAAFDIAAADMGCDGDIDQQSFERVIEIPASEQLHGGPQGGLPHCSRPGKRTSRAKAGSTGATLRPSRLGLLARSPPSRYRTGREARHEDPFQAQK